MYLYYNICRILEKPDAAKYVYKTGEIEMKNIKFGYSEDKVLYNNLNLKIDG